MFKTAFLCSNCWKACDDDVNPTYICKYCNSSRTMINLDNSFELWNGLTDEEKQNEIEIIKKFDKPHYSGEKLSDIIERTKNNFIHSIPVTTCDLHSKYKIIGPVYYQINDSLRSNLKDKVEEYQKMLGNMKTDGLLAENSFSKFENASALLGILEILSTGGLSESTKDLFGQNCNLFDICFFIAIEELKKRAYKMGANAIIGMKQDLDLDTNGFQHFYLQAYGTAVKIDTSNDELTIEDLNHKIKIVSTCSKEYCKDVDSVEIDASQSLIKCPICGLEQKSDRYKCWNCGVNFKQIYKN